LKDGTPYEVLELYPRGYTHPEKVFELSGDVKNFEEILNSIKEFKIY